MLLLIACTAFEVSQPVHAAGHAGTVSPAPLELAGHGGPTWSEHGSAAWDAVSARLLSSTVDRIIYIDMAPTSDEGPPGDAVVPQPPPGPQPQAQPPRR